MSGWLYDLLRLIQLCIFLNQFGYKASWVQIKASRLVLLGSISFHFLIFVSNLGRAKGLVDRFNFDWDASKRGGYPSPRFTKASQFQGPTQEEEF